MIRRGIGDYTPGMGQEPIQVEGGHCKQEALKRVARLIEEGYKFIAYGAKPTIGSYGTPYKTFKTDTEARAFCGDGVQFFPISLEDNSDCMNLVQTAVQEIEMQREAEEKESPVPEADSEIMKVNLKGEPLVIEPKQK